MFLLSIFIACESEEIIAKERYDTFCGLCHGYDGEGYLAPQANALANQQFLAASTDDFLRHAIIYGRPTTKMSPWGEEVGGPLNDRDVELIIQHMRTWQTLPAAQIHDMVIEGIPEDGKPLYDQLCASCHGATGEGESALSLNNPTFLESVSDGFLLHALQEGRQGTTMASYRDILTEEEMYDIVAYIRSFEE